jgi:hypothetical protein
MIISTFFKLAIFAITIFYSFTVSADQNLDGINRQISELESFLSSTNHAGHDKSYYAEAWRNLGTNSFLSLLMLSSLLLLSLIWLKQL